MLVTPKGSKGKKKKKKELHNIKTEHNCVNNLQGKTEPLGRKK